MENTKNLFVSVVSTDDYVVDFCASRFFAFVEMDALTVRGSVIEKVRFRLDYNSIAGFKIHADVLDPIDRMAYASFDYNNQEYTGEVTLEDLYKIAKVNGFLTTADMISSRLVGVCTNGEVDLDWDIWFKEITVQDSNRYPTALSDEDIPTESELEAMQHRATVRDCAEVMYHQGKCTAGEFGHNVRTRSLVWDELRRYGVWALSAKQIDAKSDMCDEVIEEVFNIILENTLEQLPTDVDFDEWLDEQFNDDEEDF